MKNAVLSNGVEVPAIAYGTWNLKSDICETVKTAIAAGYRSIDAAYSYGNDFYVGKAVKGCGVPRDQLFITNKVWNTFRGREAAVNACKKSLRLMKLDYFDLYLIHWPEPITNPDWGEINSQTWSGMEELYGEGLVRSIGVSNFLPHHIERLLSNGAAVKPMVNQVEFHPGKFPEQTYDFCIQNEIVVSGWSPIGGGEVLNHPVLTELSKKYNCSPSQICLKWAQSKQVIPVTRTESAAHMKENLLLPEFGFSDSDIKMLDDMHGVGCSPFVTDVNHPQ